MELLKQSIMKVEDFIEKYYPNYYSSDEILEWDVLHSLFKGDYHESHLSLEVLKSRYGGDYVEAYNLIEKDYKSIHVEVLEKAIENF